MHRYEIAPGACQTCSNILYPLNNCCDFSVMGGWLEGDLARVLDQCSTVADGIGGSPAAITNKNGKSGNCMSMKRDNFQRARPRRFRRLQHPTSIDNTTTSRMCNRGRSRYMRIHQRKAALGEVRSSLPYVITRTGGPKQELVVPYDRKIKDRHGARSTNNGKAGARAVRAVAAIHAVGFGPLAHRDTGAILKAR